MSSQHLLNLEMQAMNLHHRHRLAGRIKFAAAWLKIAEKLSRRYAQAIAAEADA